MRRREALTLLVGAGASWPLTVRAQQQTMPVIGYLSGSSPGSTTRGTAAFQQGLKEEGFAEGLNVATEYRWANGQYDQIPSMASELVRKRVALLAAIAPVSALAAKAATSTIPIVFLSGADPVKLGLVASLNRPGGNITGVSFFINSLVAKQFELLHELTPRAGTIAVLVNPNNPQAESQTRDAQTAALAIGTKLVVLRARSKLEIDQAFTILAEDRADAIQVTSDAYLLSERDHFVSLAARHAIPAVYSYREFAAAGGLMSYAPSLIDSMHQVGLYAGKILKGTKPTDLPVIQPTKFELVINLKTAEALGLSVPPSLLATADEVIE